MDTSYSSALDVTSQFYFCGVPFRLDTYQGCSHQCEYCFANKAFGGIRSSGISDREGMVRGCDIPSIERDFEVAFSHATTRSLRRQFLRHRVPIHWGGMSDPFQPIELREGLSLQLMDLLARYHYPVVCSTKGTILGRPEYLARAVDMGLAVQITLLTLDDTIRAGLEPLAPTVKARLRLIERCANAGLWVAVRLQPMIVDSAIEYDADRLIEEVANLGAKHLIVEGYKPALDNKPSILAVNNALGINIHSIYAKYSSPVYRRETELPTWRKYRYLIGLRELCHRAGMTYGAADNQLHEEGDTICCCGIDNLPGFENFWRYQSTQAASIARQKGTVSLDDLQGYWCPTAQFGANENWWRDNGDDKSLRGYFGWRWNEGGPDSPEDLSHMKRVIADGRVLYAWDNEPDDLRPGYIQGSMFP